MPLLVAFRSAKVRVSGPVGDKKASTPSRRVLSQCESRLFLLPHPGQELLDSRVCLQQFQRVIGPSQLPLVGNQVVNRRMAIAADVDGGLHLFLRVPLAKPGSPMAGSRDQMMPTAATFQQPTTKGALKLSSHIAIIGLFRRSDQMVPLHRQEDAEQAELGIFPSRLRPRRRGDVEIRLLGRLLETKSAVRRIARCGDEC
jgi:hypothetical protein